MACQVPVIAYEVSSMKELVVDGDNGLLAKAFEVPDLTNKILHFLNNPDELEEMGNKGRRMVELNYNREIVYKKWSDYLIKGIIMDDKKIFDVACVLHYSKTRWSCDFEAEQNWAENVFFDQDFTDKQENNLER